MKKIPLTRGKFALVDDEDFDNLNKFKWCLTCNKRGYYYAMKTVKGKTIRMHRFIMGEPKRFVDHINGDGLDNRKENLRICSIQQNNMNKRINKNNKSGVSGVRLDGRSKRYPWVAYITLNYIRMQLGRFKNKEEAVAIRKIWEKKLFGEFAFK